MSEPFDVEKEAKERVDAWQIAYPGLMRDAPGLLGSVEHGLAQFARRAIDATREEVEGEVIAEMCSDCRDGDKAIFSSADEYRDAAWWHEYPGVGGPDPEPPSGEYCRATPLHERRRKREEPTDGP